MLRAVIFGLFLIAAGSARSETIYVKYRGEVDLAPFQCQDITRSSFIFRVCYDAKESYVIIKLRSIYYHYCEIDRPTIDAFLAADSMGNFFNEKIASNAKNGKPYDCRTHRMPTY